MTSGALGGLLGAGIVFSLAIFSVNSIMFEAKK